MAGPTFSQYGYSWFRDGAFIAEALDHVGRLEWSARFHHWVARVVLSSAAGLERARAAARAGRFPDAIDYLHCRYGTDGLPADTDWPTFQLDGPGIWLWSMAHHLGRGGQLDAELFDAVGVAARYLADLWSLPCADAWEENDEQVHSSTLAGIRAGIEAAVSMVPSLAAEPAIAELRARIGDRMSVVDGAYTQVVREPRGRRQPALDGRPLRDRCGHRPGVRCHARGASRARSSATTAECTAIDPTRTTVAAPGPC